MKLTKEEQARRDGMVYALKIAKEKGVDGLEAEIKRRGISIVPVFISDKEMNDFQNRVRKHVIGTITALAAFILRNKFGWGNRGRNGNMGRLDRFKFYMNDLADSVVRNYLTVDDICEDMALDGSNLDLHFKE